MQSVGAAYPRWDSNPRTWLRRPVLYPLSYGGMDRYKYSRGRLNRTSPNEPTVDVLTSPKVDASRA